MPSVLETLKQRGFLQQCTDEPGLDKLLTDTSVSFYCGFDPTAPDLHLGLLLDVSESMGEEIGYARTASIRFVRSLDEARDVSFVDFDTEVRATRFAPQELPRLVERIRSSAPHGETALFDAIGVYLAHALDALWANGARETLTRYLAGKL